MSRYERRNEQHVILDSNAQHDGLSIPFRQSRSGAEEDLVCLFLKKFRVKVRSGFEVTFFKEPQLDSGFPDIVGVIWHKKTAEKWNTTRMLLQRNDIRIMHYISQCGTSDIKTLESLFGKKLKDSVAKLEAAEMIRQRGNKIKARSLSKLYATRHIFAIEAKISSWRTALDQAFLNRWFATSSYVLLPHIPSNNVFSEAEARGVGIWSSDQTFLDGSSITFNSLPESYASWLFNEWAWKASVVLSQPYVKPEITMDCTGIS
jgi:hypothetical protein